MLKWLFRWRSNRHRLYLFLLCTVLFFLNKHFVSNGDGRHDENEDQGEFVGNDKFERNDQEKDKDVKCDESITPPESQAIKCNADNGKPMKCWKDDEDIYFPLTYIKKRFDMTGRMSKDGLSFELLTSYSKMRTPDKKYDPSGQFGHFATYSVESRDRVRCISAESDVPMSTQWDTTPYYYPIQIAQYGLQHYSRLIATNSSRKQVVLGEKSAEWKGAAGMYETTERLFFEDENIGKVVNISAEHSLSSPGAYVYLDKSTDLHVVSFKWKPHNANSSFTILSKTTDGDMLVLVNYVFATNETRCVWSIDDDENSRKEGQISFSYGYNRSAIGTWVDVSRDLLVDVARAMSSSANRKKEENVILHPGDIRLVSLGFRGEVSVQQRIIQSSDHAEHVLFSAANWFVDNQDSEGGWPVPVERSIAERKLVLAPGWHSAMAQGHAMSLLSRAYSYSNNEKYMNVALNAVDLFNKSSGEGGVRADFFGTVWFEEYPTTPGSFVLNGFMYSLIGLYDLANVRIKNESVEIERKLKDCRSLYETGIASLRRLLPLFDTGSGTIYDLRHVGLKTAPNLARWDYHAVHVYLLKWIAAIENGDEEFERTADRWIGYAYGKKAKHN